MKRETYQVKLTRPVGVSVREMNEYIRDSVMSMQGCFHPDEPIKAIRDKPITVKRQNDSRCSSCKPKKAVVVTGDHCIRGDGQIEQL